ncbi:MAG: T9SS type A sorting domain-containing protein, partial [Bacteroidales bacterium]|nr:T9SS type A sorting domain-containing protein [Bacteroidales bacterium]
AYSDYTAQSSDVTQGSSYDLTVNVNTDGNYTVTTTVWIDWNQNCDFTDPGEEYVLGTATNTADGPTSNSPLSITIPAGALTGNTIMRVSSIYNTTASTSCQTNFDGEVEDYTVNVLASCTYPTTQASSFSATPSTTSINVGWTGGNGDAVLVVARDGSAVNQDPADGTTYTANAAFASGTQIGTGNYVVYNGTGTSVNVTGLTSGNTYYFAIYEYSSTGNCYLTPALTGNSTTTVVTFDWTGTNGSNWFDTGNWSSGIVPTSGDDATIPNVTNQPVINNGISNIAQCNNLTIDVGAKVTIDPDGYMTVAGSITNNASNSGLVINSDATGTGSLIQNSTSGVDATVNTYLGGTVQWHMVGMPVASASGIFPGTANLYTYDETVDDYWTGTSYDSPSTGWTAFANGAMTLNQGYLYNVPSATTLNYTGQLNPNTSTASLTIGYTDKGGTAANGSDYNLFDGWQLIANPYTSAIDWAAVTRTNVDDAVYYYYGTNNVYASWVNGAGTNNGTQYIPGGQGFFVKADLAAGTLGIGAAALVHNAQAFWKAPTETPENLIKLQIEGNGGTDETVIRFNEASTREHDSRFDAYKLTSNTPGTFEVYTMLNDETEYSINTIPQTSSEEIVGLRLINVPDNFIIRVTEFNFPGTAVYLKDNSDGSLTELELGTEINLSNITGGSFDRFELVFEKSTSNILISDNISVKLYPNPTNGKFYLNTGNSVSEYSVKVMNVTGQTIMEKIINNNKINELDLTNKPGGVYFVKVMFNDGSSVTKKIVKK